MLGASYKKGWKISKKATCVYEKEYVDIKRTSRCFVGWMFESELGILLVGSFRCELGTF